MQHECKGEEWLVVQEDELEAAGLCSEMDQHEADLAAINKILGSPFVQRDAMRMSGRRKISHCCFLYHQTDCRAPLITQCSWSVHASVSCGPMQRQYASVSA